MISAATVLGGLAEFERELIRARTGEGRKLTETRGVKMGRKAKLTDHQKRELYSGARPANRPAKSPGATMCLTIRFLDLILESADLPGRYLEDFVISYNFSVLLRIACKLIITSSP
jgi:hypothetical protein